MAANYREKGGEKFNAEKAKKLGARKSRRRTKGRGEGDPPYKS
jgi:hypothetical protein